MLLAIDTASLFCSAAVIDNGSILSSTMEKADKGSSTPLSTVVEYVTQKADIDLSNLEGIGISIGPGSLTGLRVGLAFSKGLCTAHSLKIAAVPTLPAAARTVKEEGVIIQPLIRAKKGYLHTALYKMKSNRYVELEAHKIISESSLSSEIFERTILVGDSHKSINAQPLADLYETLNEGKSAPIAEGVAEIGEMMLSNDEVSELANLEPDYKMQFKALKWNQEQISV